MIPIETILAEISMSRIYLMTANEDADNSNVRGRLWISLAICKIRQLWLHYS
jgi:hypothetical protein